MNQPRTQADLNAAEVTAGKILEQADERRDAVDDRPDPIDWAATLATPEARRTLAEQLWIDALLERTLGAGNARAVLQWERAAASWRATISSATPAEQRDSPRYRRGCRRHQLRPR